MPSEQYPHLSFVGFEVDRAQLSGGGKLSAQTVENKQHREAHAEFLKARLDNLNAWWSEQKTQRDGNLPELIGVPLWVQIDPTEDNSNFLRTMGFTVVSEEEDGFVLVAANEQTFVISGQKIDDFLDSQKKKNGKPASIYEMGQPETEDERIRRILPDTLQESWQTLEDGQALIVDLSISCDVKQPSTFDPPAEGESDERFAKRECNRDARVAEMVLELDDLKRKRETQIECYISSYHGEILACYDNCSEVDFPDSFTVRVSISGQGFKDILRTFPYLFQVECLEEVVVGEGGTELSGVVHDVTILKPTEDAPSVCVIDSGIQEGHRLLEPGINSMHSKNFIPGHSDTDIADYVSPVGHGTQVAGNVLYPDSIPERGEFELYGFVQNARILDENNQLPESVQPALYIEEILAHYSDKYGTKIFNHSINGAIPYRNPHMSTWAAAIDKTSYLRDVLLIQSAGNISANNPHPLRCGIQNHIQSGRDYPEYAHEPSCRLSNPAQSFQSLTVGSVGESEFDDGHRSVIAGKDKSSAFSRSGPGIWGSIKPEVVEVGGDLIRSDTTPVWVSQHSDAAPLLVQSTLHGQSSLGRKSVGTSFSAPRVSGLALQLQAMMPDETALLYRALIANCARWPEWAEQDSDPLAVLRRIGYGRPDHERALGNDPHRVTLVISDEDLYARQAKLFRVPVPFALRAAESNYDVRIDVTLSYAAMPRRTRQGHRQYLSCRLDWKCSRRNEPEESFRSNLFKRENADSDYGGYFPWMLREDGRSGTITEAQRSRGTLQKDWAVVQSHDLPEDFLIGVVGHPGWDTANQYPANFALVVSFEAVNRDVEIYEDVRVLVDQMRINEQVKVDIPAGGFD